MGRDSQNNLDICKMNLMMNNILTKQEFYGYEAYYKQSNCKQNTYLSEYNGNLLINNAW